MAGSTDGGGGPPTSLSELYRDPTARPLATLLATLVLAAGAYQTYHAVTTRAWWAGVLVALAFAGAYRLTRAYWRVQNDFVAAGLRTADLEGDEDCETGSQGSL